MILLPMLSRRCRAGVVEQEGIYARRRASRCYTSKILRVWSRNLQCNKRIVSIVMNENAYENLLLSKKNRDLEMSICKIYVNNTSKTAIERLKLKNSIKVLDTDSRL